MRWLLVGAGVDGQLVSLLDGVDEATKRCALLPSARRAAATGASQACGRAAEKRSDSRVVVLWACSSDGGERGANRCEPEVHKVPPRSVEEPRMLRDLDVCRKWCCSNIGSW